ncbi:MAG: porin family protein [Chitinophagaceae bacterium]
MKKIVLLICTVAFLSVANAQVKFGVRAGANLAGISTNDSELKDEAKTYTSFHFGVIMEHQLSKSFSFQPQVTFNKKGTKLAHGDHEDVMSFNSLDLTTNFLYKNKGFFVGAGPNFGYNLSGKVAAHHDGEHEEDKIVFGSAAGEFRRFDVGVNVTAGYETKGGLLFSVNYLKGITNLSNISSSTFRNNVLGISVGYFFSKKK